MRANACRSITRASKGNDVLLANVAEQVASRAADDGNRSRRQDIRLYNIFHHSVRQPSCGGSGLHDDGDTGEQCGGSLFAETPGRKVKRIDENGGALRGHQKMLPHESVALRERNQGALLQHFPVRQRPADFGVILHGVKGAVHIEGGIGLVCSQVQERKPKILVAICSQGLGNLGQQFSALSIAELTERRSAIGACKREGRFKIYTLRRYARQLVSGDRIDEWLPGTSAFTPLTIYVIRQFHWRTSVDLTVLAPKVTLKSESQSVESAVRRLNHTAYSRQFEPPLS